MTRGTTTEFLCAVGGGLMLLLALDACDAKTQEPRKDGTECATAAETMVVADGSEETLAPVTAPTAGDAAASNEAPAPPAGAAETVETFVKAWETREIGLLAGTLSERCQSPDVSSRLELLAMLWSFLKDGVHLSMDPGSMLAKQGYPASCTGTLKSTGGQVGIDLTLILLEEAAGWRIVDVSFKSSAEDLPDVIDPNGAFVPVQGSQF